MPKRDHTPTDASASTPPPAPRPSSPPPAPRRISRRVSATPPHIASLAIDLFPAAPPAGAISSPPGPQRFGGGAAVSPASTPDLSFEPAEPTPLEFIPEPLTGRATHPMTSMVDEHATRAMSTIFRPAARSLIRPTASRGESIRRAGARPRAVLARRASAFAPLPETCSQALQRLRDDHRDPPPGSAPAA